MVGVTAMKQATGISKKGMASPGPSPMATALVGAEVRAQLIAEAAYYRAQRRGFVPGHELEDWLAAEAEVDTGLTIGVMGN
jgi:hypothetical protein